MRAVLESTQVDAKDKVVELEDGYTAEEVVRLLNEGFATFAIRPKAIQTARAVKRGRHRHTRNDEPETEVEEVICLRFGPLDDPTFAGQPNPAQLVGTVISSQSFNTGVKWKAAPTELPEEVPCTEGS